MCDTDKAGNGQRNGSPEKKKFKLVGIKSNYMISFINKTANINSPLEINCSGIVKVM